MATIHDVARVAKVSIAAVSLVMNDPETPRVGKVKRAIILEAARSLHYAPSGIAKALTNGATRIVGLLVPMRDPIFFSYFIAQVLAGIQSTLNANRYHLMIYSHRAATGRVTADEIQQSKFIDGLIVLNTRMCSARNERDTIADLHQANIPFVMANAYYGKEPIHYVGLDDAGAAQLAGNTLFSRGYRRLAMINGSRLSPLSSALLRGWKSALAEANLPCDDNFHLYSEYDSQIVRSTTTEWMRSANRPDAIFCSDDMFAFDVYETLRQEGLQIPSDVAVLGRGNVAMGAVLTPPLTTMDVPAFELGRRSAELLLTTLADKKSSPTRVVLSCDLIERDSLKPLQTH